VLCCILQKFLSLVHCIGTGSGYMPRLSDELYSYVCAPPPKHIFVMVMGPPYFSVPLLLKCSRRASASHYLSVLPSGLSLSLQVLCQRGPTRHCNFLLPLYGVLCHTPFIGTKRMSSSPGPL